MGDPTMTARQSHDSLRALSPGNAGLHAVFLGMGPDCTTGPDVSPDILTHGFFPPLVLVLGVVRDVTGSYSIAFMLLSELHSRR